MECITSALKKGLQNDALLPPCLVTSLTAASALLVNGSKVGILAKPQEYIKYRKFRLRELANRNEELRYSRRGLRGTLCNASSRRLNRPYARRIEYRLSTEPGISILFNNSGPVRINAGLPKVSKVEQ